jgi:hypothetical protein
VADYIWTGDEDVQCEIEIEPVGKRRPAKVFRATARRIQRDGLVPLSLWDGRPAEYVETSAADAVDRAKLFLDRRFGYGAIAEANGATLGMRLFPLQQVPEQLVIAGYGRYGCPVCKIGEPDEDKLDYWVKHVLREHGYRVVTDERQAAPGIPDTGLRFRVIRLRRLEIVRTAVNDAEPGDDRDVSITED